MVFGLVRLRRPVGVVIATVVAAWFGILVYRFVSSQILGVATWYLVRVLLDGFRRRCCLWV